jgi:hypothetical protein
MLRPFDWRDLPILHRYRHQGLCLDSAHGVTRGETISPTVLLSYLTPTTGYFTWISTDDDFPILGQLSHPAEQIFGRVTFLAPGRALRNPRTQVLLENLSKQAGSRGAHNLLAEIDEVAPGYEVLRQAGFGIFARQRVWKIINATAGHTAAPKWRAIKDRDCIGVQTLFHNVVPGLVGQIEPLPTKHLKGLVCTTADEIIGYVVLKYGPQGIWAQPFIHPDVEEIDEQLNGMIRSIPDRRARPIYLCVRSYQSWLESALGEMDSQSSPLQAVMVKRLAIRKKITVPAIRHLEGQTEISPVAHSQRNS